MRAAAAGHSQLRTEDVGVCVSLCVCERFAQCVCVCVQCVSLVL